MEIVSELKDFPRAVAITRDADQCAGFAGDSHGLTGAPPLGVTRPADTDQLVAVVRWANDRKVALVPCSSPSGPRRRGDTVAAGPSVVVDLSHLDRVIHVDGENRIAVIEPGVTFAEFDRALKPHGLRSFKPLLPRRGKSVLASHLEREPITSPYDQWDTSDPLSAVELVFGEGSIFRTGGASPPGTLDENLARGLRQMVSVGPIATDFTRVLQGAQGSLGVVRWGSVYCERIPQLERASLYASDDLTPLVELAYKLLWRRIAGQMFIADRVQLALMLAADQAEFEDLVNRLPAWVLFLNVAAGPYFPEENLSYLETDVAADAASFGLERQDAVDGITADGLRALVHAPCDGDYKSRALGDYRDFFFLSQLDKAKSFVDAVNDLGAPAGFYIQPMVHGVTCHVEITFPHDGASRRQVEELRSRAVASCGARGGFFSRPYAPWGAEAFRADPQAMDTLKGIKALLDPNGIMNPDRFFS